MAADVVRHAAYASWFNGAMLSNRSLDSWPELRQPDSKFEAPLPVLDFKTQPPKSSIFKRLSSLNNLPSLKRAKTENHGMTGSFSETVAASPLPVASGSPVALKSNVGCNAAASVNSPNSTVSVSARVARAGRDRIRDVIAVEMGHQVLLKHEELRVINQEIAKCQIALEQLRRCHLIPYPVNCPMPDQVRNVIRGEGPALQHSVEARIPRFAPPFGVVDGPYTRHYSSWLIPDAAFDGTEVGEAKIHCLDGRVTRSISYSEDAGLVPGKRFNRSAPGRKSRCLSSVDHTKPDKPFVPCTIVRQSDGMRVQLVCNECNRANFGNAQGFINHCRIAHHLDFKSHEEAAQRCGQPIDAEVLPTPRDDSNTRNGRLPTAAASTMLGIHPYARSDFDASKVSMSLQLPVGSWGSAALKRKDGASARKLQSRLLRITESESTFKPSPSTPFLSQLLCRRNISTNLDEAVRDATQPVVYVEEELSTEETEENTDIPTTMLPTHAAKVCRTPTHCHSELRRERERERERRLSRKPHLKVGRHPKMNEDQPAESCSPRTIMVDDSSLRDAAPGCFSPKSVLSNQAPSLVTDNGDYEESEMVSDAGNRSRTGSLSVVPDGKGCGVHSMPGAGIGPELLKGHGVDF